MKGILVDFMKKYGIKGIEILCQEMTVEEIADLERSTVLLEAISNLMESTNWSAEEAMKALKVPEGNWKEYTSLIGR